MGHGHGGIKPSNILLDSKGNVQLSGILASVVKPDYGVMPNCSPYWLAPKINHSPNQYPFNSMAMDVWSVGITALKLAYPRPPIFLLSPFLKFLVRSRFSGFDNVNKEFSESFKNFLCIYLVDDPLKRPSADKLLNHPFFSHSNTKALDHILQKLPTIENRHKNFDVEMPKYENCPNISGWVFVKEELVLISVFHEETVSTNEDGLDSSAARPTRNEELQVMVL
ncbi:Serine/threonine-protein kinase BLUS1 [Forsythia ovata]|uniref:Serine/threonine-protein kinase BLUS1 n=1 Tax=Forsythia ovata TaxID=205694 RepID=A0ABD1PHW3_9LAMI